MESCRERILGEFQDSSGFALAERTWQWLSLGEIDPVIRELSEVMAVIRLHEVDPALLHTVWQLSGIYDGRRLDPRFEQTFEWRAPDPMAKPPARGTRHLHLVTRVGRKRRQRSGQG
jgi:hypothetical protein